MQTFEQVFTIEEIGHILTNQIIGNNLPNFKGRYTTEIEYQLSSKHSENQNECLAEKDFIRIKISLKAES